MPPPLIVDCVTWNVHRGVGGDARLNPARIARTLRTEIAPEGVDVLALQEADAVEAPYRGFLPIETICEELGLIYPQQDASLRWGPASHGFHGLIVLLAPQFEILHGAVLDLPGHCHRGAVVIEAKRAGVSARFVVTHLSRLQVLRIAQMRTLGQFIARRPPMQTVLLGDCNDWRYWRGTAFSPRIACVALEGPRRATFPVGRPFLPLDRILSDRPGAVADVRVLDGPGIRAASDHRPLAARVRVEAPA